MSLHQIIVEREKALEKKFDSASCFCSCMEGDMYDEFPEAMKELKNFSLHTSILLLTALKEKIDEELAIQKQVQEKSKEIVVVGRARVAGMVAEKYTRIGKIAVLSDLKEWIESEIIKIKEMK